MASKEPKDSAKDEYNKALYAIDRWQYSQAMFFSRNAPDDNYFEHMDLKKEPFIANQLLERGIDITEPMNYCQRVAVLPIIWRQGQKPKDTQVFVRIVRGTRLLPNGVPKKLCITFTLNYRYKSPLFG